MDKLEELINRLNNLNKTKKSLKRSCKNKSKKLNKQKNKIIELEDLLYQEKLISKKLKGKLTAIKLYSKRKKSNND